MKKIGYFFSGFLPILTTTAAQILASFFMFGIAALFLCPASQSTGFDADTIETLLTNTEFNACIMLIYNNNKPAAPIEVRNLDGTSTTYNIPPETNSGVIDEFVDALEHDREPEVSGREALSTMRAIFGSIKSSEIGRTVSVNDSYVNHL